MTGSIGRRSLAFIENPTVELDTSCVAGLTPCLALPEIQPEPQAAGGTR